MAKVTELHAGFYVEYDEHPSSVRPHLVNVCAEDGPWVGSFPADVETIETLGLRVPDRIKNR